MANWTIKREDGEQTTATIENGNAWFPENNTQEDINYIITYTDNNGITGQTSYTIPNCYTPPVICNCNALTISETTIQINSAATIQNIGTIVENCISSFNVQGTIPWFTVYTEGTNVVLSAQTNNTDPNGRQAGVVLKVGDNACVNPLMVQQLGRKASFNIYIYGIIDTDNTIYKIDIEYDREDGLPSASEYPLTITNKTAAYHYTNCSMENVSPTNVPLPVTYRICQGTSGDILGRPTLDAISCRVAIAGAERSLIVRSTTEKDEFEWTIQNITYHVQLTMFKPNDI